MSCNPKFFTARRALQVRRRTLAVRLALQLIRPTGSFRAAIRPPRPAAMAKSHQRGDEIRVSFQRQDRRDDVGAKISLSFFRNLWFTPAIPARMRGVSRSSRTLGRRCGGRDEVAGRAASSRTTKPCGPGLPTLRPSRAKRRFCAAMGARKPGPQGERVISRKAIAQGRPDCSVLTCGSFPVLFLRTGAAGVADTRPSLRPLFSEGQIFSQDSDASAPRE